MSLAIPRSRVRLPVQRQKLSHVLLRRMMNRYLRMTGTRRGQFKHLFKDALMTLRMRVPGQALSSSVFYRQTLRKIPTQRLTQSVIVFVRKTHF